MISVRASDARKGLGLVLGFGGGGASPRIEMEDTELEEGEAYSYHDNHNNNDGDATIDPDIALSYIDVKLQDVLGHFQKDFEGGVSAENLGAKFGGYGSFLPMHQRSPAWSQRTPPKFQGYSASRSPYNFHPEGGLCNSVVSSTAPQSGGRGPCSTSSTSHPAIKMSAVNGSGKQVIGVLENRIEESTRRVDLKNKKHSSAADQKTLKVRIKVGSDNPSERKNAAIYSGLGLDDSPSSSLDDSSSESEGLSHERQDIPFESPTSILKIMTSFPIHGGVLLSPLHEDLTNLMEKGKYPKDSKYVPFPTNGSDAMKVDGKMGELKIKSAEKNDNSAESKSGNDKDARDVSKKEPEMDALACEELVSNTLRLPILSNSYSNSGDVVRSREANQSVLKDCISSDRGEERETESVQNDVWVDKRKSSSAGKILVEGKESSFNEISVHPSKEGQLKGERNYDPVKPDSNVSKARRMSNQGGPDSSKQKASKKATVQDQGSTRLPHGKEILFTGEKKSKGSHGTASADAPKDSARASSSMPKTKKSTAENHMYNKAVGKMETYKDFFGELEEDNLMDFSETPVDNKPKDSDASAKSKSAASKEKPNTKRMEKPSTLEAIPSITLVPLGPRSGNELIPNAAQPPAPVLIEENWVCCDKCQKWRLLPIGTNPDNLPEKWLCSMLNWLPGMNRCSFTEEETNNALIALYHAPLPDNQANPGGIFSGTSFGHLRHPDQSQHNFSGKKKNGLKVMSSGVKKESPTLSNPSKKNMQSSVAKSRSLNDVTSSPPGNESEFLPLSKCNNNSSVENQRQKYEEKSRADAPAGDSKSLKVKSRRDSDCESSRALKKLKNEPKNTFDEGWASDHSGAVGKVGPTSSGSNGRDRAKYSEHPFSKDIKFNVKDMPQVSNSKVKVKSNVPLENSFREAGDTEIKDGSKKRKIKEAQNSSFLSAERNAPDSIPFAKEEFSDNDHRKEKKPNISRTENNRTDKKRSHTKNQTSLAATSSSSKVSGSHKSKSSFQEVKGSPVESVSSSPMRISNPEKSTAMKVEFQSAEDMERIDRYHTANDLECPSRDFPHASSSKVRKPVLPSPDIRHHNFENGALDNISGQDGQQSRKPSDHFINEEKQNESHYQPRKTAKGSCSSKLDKSRSFKSDGDTVRVRLSDASDGKKKMQDKIVINSNETGEKSAIRKDIVGKQLNETCIETRVDPTTKQNMLLESNHNERHSKRAVSMKPEQVEAVSSGERSVLLPPSCTLNRGSHKGNGGEASQIDASNGENAQKVQKPIKKADNHNRSQHISSKNPSKNGHRARDIEVPSLARKDLPSHAATNALKEAKDLKHMADRLRSAGSSHERTGLYFQAALKFLYGASLLESGSSDPTNFNDIVRSRQTYRETGQLCEFCAYEYEKSKDMGAAALAFKCSEVAFMRVVYSSYSGVNRDRNELQQASHRVNPHGESPSSSASDIDNLNNHTTADKVAMAKGVGLPQAAANHVIAAPNRLNFDRVLNFAQDVASAMEASKKSLAAFEGAGGTADFKCGEALSSIKRALDFTFQDVDGFLRLVRLAMEIHTR